ncbi:MAG: histidine phosphatase family protein [Deltaproteobacteria bacterium]|nr:histidine phosphatase family protein [Deltaproteobacteria bacterium]
MQRPNSASPRPGASPVAMPARVIYLVRHGRSGANALGQVNGATVPDGLDSVGYQQRVGLYVLLRSAPICAIFTSTLARTQQTALPLARHFALPLKTTSDLDEFHGGVFEGICTSIYRRHKRRRLPVQKMSPAESPDRTAVLDFVRRGCVSSATDSLSRSGATFIRDQARRAAQNPLGYRAPGGGESVQDVIRRLRHFLGEVPANLHDRTILIVGHGGTNRFLLGLLMHWPAMSARSVRQTPSQVFRITRQAGRVPKLQVWTGTRWRLCPQPPNPHRGLRCLKPVTRPPARPVDTTFPTQ